MNAADPARPTLLSGQVAVKPDVGGSGIFSAVPVNLTATAAGGKITLSTRLTNLSLSFGGISARLTADFAWAQQLGPKRFAQLRNLLLDLNQLT